MAALLEVRDLEVFYGRIQAIKGISFEVNEGEIVTLIGANGAGKTTTMKTMSGVRPVAAGSIKFDGADVTKAPSHKRVGMGIGQSPRRSRHLPGNVRPGEPRYGHVLAVGSEVPCSSCRLGTCTYLIPPPP